MEKKRQTTIDNFFVPLKKKSVGETKKEDKGSVVDNKVDLNEVTKTEDKQGDKNGNDIKVKNLNKLSDLPKGLQPLLKLEYETLDPSWTTLLINEFQKPYFIKLKKFLKSEAEAGKKIFPPEKDIYSWSRYTPVDQVKVVIIGQDPYHNDNQAHGLCFSVNKGIPLPPSLRNMYKEIKDEYPDFNIPKHGYLASWAQQGVLLLNAALTVNAHQANSHAGKGWEQFTDAAIQKLSLARNNLVFILWGSYAQKKGKVINKDNHLILNGVHPSPLSASRGFFGCNHFKKANDYLIKNNMNPIEWTKIE